MKKVIILVEGPTEERFVKTVLSPHLASLGIFLSVTILNTKKVKDGPNFKGGVYSYQKIKNDLTLLFYDSSISLVTTMFDYYGLPTSFPGFSTQSGTCYQRVKHLEDAFKEEINNKYFYPYLQLHEFEALLFSSPDHIIDTLPNSEKNKEQLLKIRQAFHTPEEINNNPETCPSRRLIKLFPEYDKIIFGTLISVNIGLDIIRKECPHFNEWLTKLESI